jgi:hypothetical protein
LHSVADADSQPKRNRHSYCHSHSYCHCHSYCISNTDCDRGAEVYSNTTASSDASSALVGYWQM